MSTTTVFRCDGPGCVRHVNGGRNGVVPGKSGFLTVYDSCDLGNVLHFCGWDCCLRHAGTHEPEEVIYPGDVPGEDA